MPEMGWKMPERSGEKSNFALTCSLLSQYIKEKGSLADLGGFAMAPQPNAKGKPEAFRPPTTMSLLPGADVPRDNGYAETKGDGTSARRNATRSMDLDLFPQRAGLGPSVPVAAADDAGKAADAREPEKAQLTIFYGGKVLVFDNFPAEKAKDLMQLASKGISTAQNFSFVPSSSAAPAAADHPNGPSHGSSTFAPAATNPPTAIQGTCAQRPPQSNPSFLPMARKQSLHRFLEKRKDRINTKAPYQANGSPAVVKQEESQSWLGLGTQISKPSLSSECSK